MVNCGQRLHVLAEQSVFNRRDVGWNGRAEIKEGWKAHGCEMQQMRCHMSPRKWPCDMKHMVSVGLAPTNREDEKTTSGETWGKKTERKRKYLWEKRLRKLLKVDREVERWRSKQGRNDENHRLFIISVILCLDSGSDHTLDLSETSHVSSPRLSNSASIFSCHHCPK